MPPPQELLIDREAIVERADAVRELAIDQESDEAEVEEMIDSLGNSPSYRFSDRTPGVEYRFDTRMVTCAAIMSNDADASALQGRGREASGKVRN